MALAPKPISSSMRYGPSLVPTPNGAGETITVATGYAKPAST